MYLEILQRNLNKLIFDSFKELDKVIEKVIKMTKEGEKFTLGKESIVALISLLKNELFDKQ